MKDSDLSKKILSKKEIKRIDKKLNLLGKKRNITAINFINSRIISSVVVFLVALDLFNIGFVIAPILTIIYYYLFEKIFLDNKINKRRIDLESESIHFFEVLTLSLETGRNLVEAIDVTTSNVMGDLSDEFKEAVREVSFGKSLNEALTDMQLRIPSENVNNIVLSLTQANLYGNSIIDNLYNQIDYLREKRKLEVKGRISKVPVYISVISVFFFIPLLLMIVLGPVLLSFMK